MTKYTPHGWFPRIRNRPVRLVAEILALLLVCGLLGLAIGYGAKALGEVPPTLDQRRDCVDMHQQPCRARASRYAVRKFRHGRLGHARAVERRLFVHPRAGRTAMIHRFARALRHHRHHRADQTSTARVTARAAYRHWLGDSDCGAYRPYSPYSTGIDVCSLAGPRSRLDGDDIRHGVTVIICAGGVAAGVIAAPPTGTASWWVVGMGSAACFWSAYLALSDE